MNAVVLSFALDTNGQNARFVQAAERWGADESVLRALAIGNQDPAGVVGRFKSGAEKGDALRIRSVHRTAAYMAFLGDLTRPAPDVLHSLPTAYDIDWLQDFAKQRRKAAKRDPDRIRIVHCPTNREYKATDVLVAAVVDLQAEELPVDLQLVEGRTWAHSLTAKANADIVFDQLAWGYGCNAVEAWGLGIPVVSGADEWTLARMHQEFGKGLPFMEATQETLTDVLRKLVTSKDLRAKWAAKGLRHVRKYHDERPALARLAELYQKTITNYATKGNRLGKPVPAVRFRGSRRPVSIDGERIIFQDGEYATTDPFVIAKLRYFATQRKAWGIEEVA